MKSLDRLARCCSRCACWIPPQHHVRADGVTCTSGRVHTVDNSAGLQAGSPVNATTLMKTAPFSSFTRSTPSSPCRQQSSPGCLIPAHFILQDAARPRVPCCCTGVKARSRWGGGWQCWLLLTGSAKLIHT